MQVFEVEIFFVAQVVSAVSQQFKLQLVLETIRWVSYSAAAIKRCGCMMSLMHSAETVKEADVPRCDTAFHESRS